MVKRRIRPGELANQSHGMKRGNGAVSESRAMKRALFLAWIQFHLPTSSHGSDRTPWPDPSHNPI
jgi:hypothetical protein